MKSITLNLDESVPYHLATYSRGSPYRLLLVVTTLPYKLD